MKRGLGNCAGPIKPEIHELKLFRWYATGQGSRARFRLSDQGFDLEQIFRIMLARSFASKEIQHAFFDPFRMFLINFKKAIEFTDKIGEPPGIMVKNRNVAAGHVGNVYLMTLLDKPN